jgi:hypothetical protein
LAKDLIDIYGIFYHQNDIPSSEKMLELSDKLRGAIDILLVLGITPIDQTDF